MGIPKKKEVVPQEITAPADDGKPALTRGLSIDVNITKSEGHSAIQTEPSTSRHAPIDALSERTSIRQNSDEATFAMAQAAAAAAAAAAAQASNELPHGQSSNSDFVISFDPPGSQSSVSLSLSHNKMLPEPGQAPNVATNPALT